MGGVNVRVMLNPVRSNGARPNDKTFAAFKEAGIDTDWTSPHFLISHEKSAVIDGRYLLIATFNLSDKYFTKTRDYGVVLDDRVLAQEVTACFEADRRREPFEPFPGSPLAWGNQNARRAVAGFIDSAKTSLSIQQPKFRDATILDHVLDAQARGVKIKVLCGGKHGIEDQDIAATFSYQRILARAGIHLKRQRDLKLHAKIIIADDERLFIGSMNIDRDAYDLRRELGISLADKHAVAKLKDVFDADWKASKDWQAPDPLTLDLKLAVDAEDDPLPLLVHE